MNPTLVILAAGAGARYGGLKQLAPIGPGGETLLEYSAFDALRAGFGRVVLVVRPETERAFHQRLDAGMARRVPVAYVHQRLNDLPVALERPTERVKPWGTGHAVLRHRFAEFLSRSGRVADAEFLLPEVVQSLVRNGFRVEVLPGRGEWCGITFRQDEERVKSVISSRIDRGRYPQELWA